MKLFFNFESGLEKLITFHTELSLIDMKALQKQLLDFAMSLEVDYFGVADLSKAKDFVLEQGGEAIARFPRAVSIGMRLINRHY